jgi:hypothetical protein
MLEAWIPTTTTATSKLEKKYTWKKSCTNIEFQIDLKINI